MVVENKRPKRGTSQPRFDLDWLMSFHPTRGTPLIRLNVTALHAFERLGQREVRKVAK